jgi:hypothetical protein
MRFAIAARAGRIWRGPGLLALATALASCSGTGTKSWTFADMLPKSGPGAVAKLSPKNSSSVTGTVTFVQRGDKVVVAAVVHELSALPPDGRAAAICPSSSPAARAMPTSSPICAESRWVTALRSTSSVIPSWSIAESIPIHVQSSAFATGGSPVAS